MRVLAGRRSVRCLLEFPHEVIRRWARRLASVVLDWSQVTSLSPPHPAASFSVTTTNVCLLYSSNPIHGNPLLSPHQFVTSLHPRPHRPPWCGPVPWPASLRPGRLGVAPARLDQVPVL